MLSRGRVRKGIFGSSAGHRRRGASSAGHSGRGASSAGHSGRGANSSCFYMARDQESDSIQNKGLVYNPQRLILKEDKGPQIPGIKKN